jgi:hypothetical protein
MQGQGTTSPIGAAATATTQAIATSRATDAAGATARPTTGQAAGAAATPRPTSRATTAPATSGSRSQPTRAAVAGSAGSDGGTQPPTGGTPQLGKDLPAASGGLSLWLAPLAGLVLLIHTIRVRRGKTAVRSQ